MNFTKNRQSNMQKKQQTPARSRSEMAKKCPISEANFKLPAPVHYPEDYIETVEEFLARGGQIQFLPPKLAPDIEPGDPPRQPYTGWGKYNS